jgi:uncharacterized membrane protein YfcA
MLIKVILTLFIGVIAGIIGGALGQVGTFIILPLLLILNVIPDYKLAVGTILLAMLPPISAFAVYDYYKRKKIDFLIAALLCVSYTLSSSYGAVLNNRFNRKQLELWTAVMFFIVGSYFMWSAYH